MNDKTKEQMADEFLKDLEPLVVSFTAILTKYAPLMKETKDASEDDPFRCKVEARLDKWGHDLQKLFSEFGL